MAKGGCSNKEVGYTSQGCAKEDNEPQQKDKKEKENENKIDATIDFRISIFYDGTGNNAFNIYIKELVEKENKKIHKAKDQISEADLISFQKENLYLDIVVVGKTGHVEHSQQIHKFSI